jgi:uncharacterized protein (DUF488 family)
MGTIYTAGYGNIAIDRFLNLLKRHKIGILIDIRSRPYPKSRPEYHKQPLDRFIRKEGIEYIFLGDKLGGRPKSEAFYGPKGTIDYELLQQSPSYKQGVSELIAMADKSDVCIMCAEMLPEKCHRGFLVSETLYKMGIETRHILHGGNLIGHGELRAKFKGGQIDLF